jgi:hypothetical protein
MGACMLRQFHGADFRRTTKVRFVTYALRNMFYKPVSPSQDHVPAKKNLLTYKSV